MRWGAFKVSQQGVPNRRHPAIVGWAGVFGVGLQGNPTNALTFLEASGSFGAARWPQIIPREYPTLNPLPCLDMVGGSLHFPLLRFQASPFKRIDC